MVEVQLLPLEDAPAGVLMGEEEKAEYVLLCTKFWEPCMEHAAENKPEKCVFCLRCYNGPV
jgi:hypothetical protein